MLCRCCEMSMHASDGVEGASVCISATLMPCDSALVCEQRGEAGGGVIQSMGLTYSTEGHVKLMAPTVNSISRTLIRHNRGLKKPVSWRVDRHVLPHAAVNTGIRSELINFC